MKHQTTRRSSYSRRIHKVREQSRREEPEMIDTSPWILRGCPDCGPGSLDPDGESGERRACANCDRVFRAPEA